MKCPDCGSEVYIKKRGRGIIKRRGKVIDVKDIEFIQCKKCGKYLNTEKIVDNLRILSEYMLQMEIKERIEEEDKAVKSVNYSAIEKSF